MDGRYLYIFLSIGEFRIFPLHQQCPHNLLQFRNGFYIDYRTIWDKLIAEILDNCNGMEILPSFFEYGMMWQFIRVKDPIFGAAISVQEDSIRDSNGTLSRLLDEKDI